MSSYRHPLDIVKTGPCHTTFYRLFAISLPQRHFSCDNELCCDNERYRYPFCGNEIAANVKSQKSQYVKKFKNKKVKKKNEYCNNCLQNLVTFYSLSNKPLEPLSI